jgi:plastocyanin
VNSSGLVTGVSAGTAVIALNTTDGGYGASSTITVTTPYTLTTTASPTAGGTIGLSPAGGSYASGTTVTATATANSGYTFTSWSGALTGSTNPGTITMNANKTLTATFTATTTYALTITTPTNGTITASPAGPNYASGTTVTLTATPSSGYQFSSWGGSASGTISPTTLTMNGNKTVSATFSALPAGADNLGNHTATQNIKLGTYWLSGDGGNEGIRVDASGNVGIGTANPTQPLTVRGKILATEVEVVSSIAADYVFEPEYQLMPLTDLELYLRQNKHLPNIPSAADFAKQGQNLGKMDDLLLRKIEELTLYMIKQDKVVSEQRKAIEELRREIETIKRN